MYFGNYSSFETSLIRDEQRNIRIGATHCEVFVGVEMLHPAYMLRLEFNSAVKFAKKHRPVATFNFLPRCYKTMKL